MKKYFEFLPVALVIFAMTTAVVRAQESVPAAPVAAAAPAPAAAAADAAAPAAAPAGITLTDEEKKTPFSGSFFFTVDQITKVKKAKEGGRKASPLPVAGNGMNGAPGDNGDISKALEQLVPQHRVISLGGVFYRSPQDWVVWINGEKVTPKNKLPQIVDIHVESSSKVNLKWYDEGVKSTLAITMRPHQTYDIGAGILLPGTGSN